MKKDFCLHGILLCLGIAYCSHVSSTRKSSKLRQSFHGHHEKGKEGQVLHRSKRGWVWNQFFVIEEYTGPDPVLVGRVRHNILILLFEYSILLLWKWIILILLFWKHLNFNLPIKWFQWGQDFIYWTIEFDVWFLCPKYFC